MRMFWNVTKLVIYMVIICNVLIFILSAVISHIAVQKEKGKSVPLTKEKIVTPYVRRSKIRNSISHFLGGCIKYTGKMLAILPSNKLRLLLYRKLLQIKIGKKSIIYSGAKVISPWKIQIGAHSIVGDDNILDGRGRLSIGNNVNLSTGVWIWTGQHCVQGEWFEYESAPVIIEDYVWLGGRTIIMPGVKVGYGAVVASGAVVTKDCEPYGIYAGIPAKKIGTRNRNLKYSFDGKSDWFF